MTAPVKCPTCGRKVDAFADGRLVVHASDPAPAAPYHRCSGSMKRPPRG